MDIKEESKKALIGWLEEKAGVKRSPVERGVGKPRCFHVERFELRPNHIAWLVVHKEGWQICEAYSRRDALRISKALNREAC